MFTVRRSLPTKVTFQYTSDHTLLRQATPEEIERGGLRKAALQNKIMFREHHGPHLFLHLQCESPVIRVIGSPVPLKQMKLPVPLQERISRQDKIDRWHSRNYQGWLIEIEGLDSEICQTVFYQTPVQVNYRKSSSRRCGDGHHGCSGIINSTWYPRGRDKVDHLNHPREYWRIADPHRFPEGPCDRLDFETAKALKVGDTFGTLLGTDRPLELGFDEHLASLGFSAEPSGRFAGKNCVTDWGLNYSFPLRCPTRTEWDKVPLPMPLEAMLALRDTPEHSWLDVVLSFVGWNNISIDAGPRNGKHDTPPTAASRNRPVKCSTEHAQPCYAGPRLDTHRIGRYTIFTVLFRDTLVYLLDSNWRDKEVALHLFLTKQDAVDYVNGKRGHQVGWLAHNDGWDADGYVEAWIARSLAKRQTISRSSEQTLEAVSVV